MSRIITIASCQDDVCGEIKVSLYSVRNQLKIARNRSGVLISKIDLDKKFYDPSSTWRVRVLKGNFTSKRQPIGIMLYRKSFEQFIGRFPVSSMRTLPPDLHSSLFIHSFRGGCMRNQMLKIGGF